MSLALQVYHNPKKFLLALDTAAEHELVLDVPGMSLILGAAREAEDEDDKSIWMLVLSPDATLADDGSDSYTLDVSPDVTFGSNPLL